MSQPTDDLGRLWEWFAHGQFQGYSPLYERIALAVAHDREVLELVREAPPDAHLPPALLGAVHYLLLDGLEHPLAEVYAGRSDDDPAPLFSHLCRTHRDEVAALLAARTVQTNECGRSAVIGPALTWIASEMDGPLALVDVGASAGLNLLCDRYRLDYGQLGTTGPTGSPVEIRCRVLAGAPPIAERLPSLVARVGIDRTPVNLADPDDARWLLACVWPDTGRLERTAAAIRLAQENLPPLVAGDANDALGGVLDVLPAAAVAVVLTTWAFAYLSIEDRQRFVNLLETQSFHRPIAWLSADGLGVVEAFAGQAGPDHDPEVSSVLGAVMLDRGVRREQLLGYVHQHGASMDWQASPG